MKRLALALIFYVPATALGSDIEISPKGPCNQIGGIYNTLNCNVAAPAPPPLTGWAKLRQAIETAEGADAAKAEASDQSALGLATSPAYAKPNSDEERSLMDRVKRIETRRQHINELHTAANEFRNDPNLSGRDYSELLSNISDFDHAGFGERENADIAIADRAAHLQNICKRGFSKSIKRSIPVYVESDSTSQSPNINFIVSEIQKRLNQDFQSGIKNKSDAIINIVVYGVDVAGPTSDETDTSQFTTYKSSVKLSVHIQSVCNESEFSQFPLSIVGPDGKANRGSEAYPEEAAEKSAYQHTIAAFFNVFEKHFH